MRLIDHWPVNIQRYLTDNFGLPAIIDKLNGIKKDGGCYRIKFFGGSSIIVKLMTNPQEYLFYNECTRLIKGFRKNIPVLLWSCIEEGTFWCILEDVPNPLPKSRWNADSEIIELLSNFHYEMWDRSLPIKDNYIPKWDIELTEAVLKLFSDKIANEIQPILAEIQKSAQQLFHPYCWINADTNPTNWGIRNDSTIVLFDWERVCCGSPAIDLAITIPGLGTLDNSIELLISKRYIEMWSKLSKEYPFSEKNLLEQIILAKLWSIVEFLGNSSAMLDYGMLQSILRELTDKLYKLM